VSEQSDLIENAEHFAQIDPDLSDFEKERTHCISGSGFSLFSENLLACPVMMLSSLLI